MTLKQMIQSALPTWSGRLAAHHVGYLGNGQVHRAVPYAPIAVTPAIVAKKLTLMQAAGIDICIETWQGIYATSCNEDAILFSQMCGQFGMQFALLLDPWCAKLSATGTNTLYTSNVTTSLQAPTTQAILNAPSYVPERYVLDFNTGANLTLLGAAFPKVTFLAQGSGFSWISIPSVTDSPARNVAAVNNLKSQNSNPAMKIPGVCFSFNDSGQPLPVGVSTQAAFDASGGIRNYAASVWGGPARVLESFSGNFMQQQLGVTPTNAGIIALITWDDYDELSSGPYELVMAQNNGMIW